MKPSCDGCYADRDIRYPLAGKYGVQVGQVRLSLCSRHLAALERCYRSYDGATLPMHGRNFREVSVS